MTNKSETARDEALISMNGNISMLTSSVDEIENNDKSAIQRLSESKQIIVLKAEDFHNNLLPDQPTGSFIQLFLYFFF